MNLVFASENINISLYDESSDGGIWSVSEGEEDGEEARNKTTPLPQKKQKLDNVSTQNIGRIRKPNRVFEIMNDITLEDSKRAEAALWFFKKNKTIGAPANILEGLLISGLCRTTEDIQKQILECIKEISMDTLTSIFHRVESRKNLSSVIKSYLLGKGVDRFVLEPTVGSSSSSSSAASADTGAASSVHSFFTQTIVTHGLKSAAGGSSLSADQERHASLIQQALDDLQSESPEDRKLSIAALEAALERDATTSLQTKINEFLKKMTTRQLEQLIPNLNQSRQFSCLVIPYLLSKSDLTIDRKIILDSLYGNRGGNVPIFDKLKSDDILQLVKSKKNISLGCILLFRNHHAKEVFPMILSYVQQLKTTRLVDGKYVLGFLIKLYGKHETQKTPIEEIFKAFEGGECHSDIKAKIAEFKSKLTGLVPQRAFHPPAVLSDFPLTMGSGSISLRARSIESSENTFLADTFITLISVDSTVSDTSFGSGIATILMGKNTVFSGDIRFSGSNSSVIIGSRLSGEGRIVSDKKNIFILKTADNERIVRDQLARGGSHHTMVRTIPDIDSLANMLRVMGIEEANVQCMINVIVE